MEKFNYSGISNSANSRHSNVERGLVLVVGIEPTFSYGLTAKKGRGDYYPLVSEPFIQPFLEGVGMQAIVQKEQ